MHYTHRAGLGSSKVAAADRSRTLGGQPPAATPPLTSKLTTRDDGNMYQEIAHFVGRSTLYTPKSTTNMMTPESYTGHRVTEGVYDSGEKFTDTTPWYANGAVTKDQVARDARQMKERWRGKTFLELSILDPPEIEPLNKPPFFC